MGNKTILVQCRDNPVFHSPDGFVFHCSGEEKTFTFGLATRLPVPSNPGSDGNIADQKKKPHRLLYGDTRIAGTAHILHDRCNNWTDQ